MLLRVMAQMAAASDGALTRVAGHVAGGSDHVTCLEIPPVSGCSVAVAL